MIEPSRILPVKKQGVVHFFQYSPEMTSNRHHWQTSVEGLAHHDWFKAQKALNLTNEKAQRCENVADKAPAQFRPHRFAKTLPPPEVTQALSTKRGKLTSQRGASRGASTNGTRVRLLLDSEGCHLLPGGLRPAVPRMRQAGAPTPGTHSGKTIGLPTGRSEWGKSPSTRRTGARVPVRRDVVNARSMPFDQSLPTGAFASARKRAFSASSRDARRVLASAPREETDASPSKFFSPALGIRPPLRCTRRIRWRGDTSAHGYVILVRMAQQRCVGVRADDNFFARVCRNDEPIKSRGLTTLGWLVQKRKRDVPVRLRCPSPRGVIFPSNTS